jgi:hypothetical protein
VVSNLVKSMLTLNVSESEFGRLRKTGLDSVIRGEDESGVDNCGEAE